MCEGILHRIAVFITTTTKQNKTGNPKRANVEYLINCVMSPRWNIMVVKDIRNRKKSLPIARWGEKGIQIDGVHLLYMVQFYV